MVQVGDVIRIKDVQVADGIDREMLNVYFFEITAVTGLPVLNSLGEFFSNYWIGNLIPDLLASQASQLQHIRIEVDNLMAFETEFFVFSYAEAVPGEIIDDQVSTVLTFSLQLNREFRTTRNGRKGIPGVGKSMAANNEIAPGVLETLTEFGSTLLSPPNFSTGTGVGFSMLPVIAKTPTPPATIPTVFNGVNGVTIRGVGTQNSRKVLGT